MRSGEVHPGYHAGPPALPPRRGDALLALAEVQDAAPDPDQVARIAAAAGVVVLELARHTENLEELFFDLVSDRTLEVSPS